MCLHRVRQACSHAAKHFAVSDEETQGAAQHLASTRPTSAEQCYLHALVQIAPKEDEVKALQSYAGRTDELSLPEQFLLVMSGVPRLHNKIHLLILVRQFEVLFPSAGVHAKQTCAPRIR